MYILHLYYLLIFSFLVLVNSAVTSGEAENSVTHTDNGPTNEGGSIKQQRGDQQKQQRSNRPPPSRRGDSKPKDALVNGTTA